MYCWKVAFSDRVQSTFGEQSKKKNGYEIFYNVDIDLAPNKTTDAGLPGVNYEFMVFDHEKLIKKLDNAQITHISAYVMTVMGLIPVYKNTCLQYRSAYCYCWIYNPTEQDKLIRK
jgi:hypothetical protein